MKLGIVIGLLFLTIIVLFSYTYFSFYSLTQNANAIDDAGRQRMLIQRLGRTAELLANGDKKQQATLKKTIRLFEQTQQNLITGSKKLNYPEPATSEIRQKLLATYRAWQPFKKNLKVLVNAEHQHSSTQRQRALHYIRGHTEELVLKMHKAVNAWSEYTEAEIDRIIWRELLLLGSGLLLGSLVSSAMYSSIVEPVRELQSATKKIKTGNLPPTVEVKTRDEIGMLAENFNEMSSRLKETTVSRDYLDDILNNMSDMIVVATCSNPKKTINCPATIEEVNSSLKTNLGYERGELKDEPLRKICGPFCPRGVNGEEKEEAECLINRGIKNKETVLQKKNGQKFPVLLSMTELDNSRIIIVATDITKRVEARRELEQRERQFRQMAENFDEVFWIFDGNWEELIYLDQQYSELYGGRREKVENDPRSFLENIHPEDREKVEQAVEKLKQGEEVELEYRVNPGADFKRWVWVEGVPIINAENEVTRIIGASREITERKQMEMQLQYGAIHDLQTGLYNHSHFKEELEHQLERTRRYAERLSVILFDIDHFKQINDEHGHLKGDEVLEEIATIFQKLTRESDLVARYGGEEFGLILPQTDAGAARQLAERILKEIESSKSANLDVTITVSGGIASVENEDITADTLLHQADEALYTAKIQGRNRVKSYSKQEDDTDAL